MGFRARAAATEHAGAQVSGASSVPGAHDRLALPQRHGGRQLDLAARRIRIALQVLGAWGGHVSQAGCGGGH